MGSTAAWQVIERCEPHYPEGKARRVRVPEPMTAQERATSVLGGGVWAGLPASTAGDIFKLGPVRWCALRYLGSAPGKGSQEGAVSAALRKGWGSAWTPSGLTLSRGREGPPCPGPTIAHRLRWDGHADGCDSGKCSLRALRQLFSFCSIFVLINVLLRASYVYLFPKTLVFRILKYDVRGGKKNCRELPCSVE